MWYFLKNIGMARGRGSKNLIKEFEDFGSCFWNERSKVWFSNSNFGGNVSKGDIIIQYIPCSYKSAQFAGRIVGVYRVISEKIFLPNKQWKVYFEVENLCLKFSQKSKEKTILHIKQVLNNIPKAIQCGCAKISVQEAEKMIEQIKKSEEVE